MKLYLNKPSPYARLVLVVAHEKGLAGQLTLEWTDPWQNLAPLTGVNPFSRVPALVIDEGPAIVDSACICDYLDHAGSGRKLVPAALAARTTGLAKYGLARTLTDSAFGAVIERRFNPSVGEPALTARWLAAARSGLDLLEKQPSIPGSTVEPDLGDLALGVALGYIDFRLQELDWRATRPRLAWWHAQIDSRDSFKATGHA